MSLASLHHSVEHVLTQEPSLAVFISQALQLQVHHLLLLRLRKAMTRKLHQLYQDKRVHQLPIQMGAVLLPLNKTQSHEENHHVIPLW